MNLRQLNLRERPAILLERLAALPKTMRLRRRAAFVRSENDAEWKAAFFIIDAALDESCDARETITHRYNDLILCEDHVERDECRTFIDELAQGDATIGKRPVTVTEPQHWQVERLPARNNSSPQAATLIGVSLPQLEARPISEIFVSGDAPYFPSYEAALNHWATLNAFHGEHDARMGQGLFLFPERRGRIADIRETSTGLSVFLDGDHITSEGVRLRAAMKCEGVLKHIDKQIHHCETSIEMPSASEWDVLLTTNTDEFLDRWTDRDLFGNAYSTASEGLANIVLQAVQGGESETIEFKPFVRLALTDKKSSAQDQEASGSANKLREIYRTIIAFANHRGGQVILGVDDHCQLIGGGTIVREATKAELSDETLERYRGALLARLKDNLIITSRLTVNMVVVRDKLTAVIDVQSAAPEVAQIKDDPVVYVRCGANNTRLSPSDMPKFLASRQRSSFPNSLM